MTLVIHPLSERMMNALIVHKPHALLVTGPRGIGASTIAKYIADQSSKTTLTVLPEKDEKVDLDSGVITAGLIRGLYNQTRTKSGERVVIIDDAERMTPQAQNAFLKLLEEPTEQTSFILVCHDPQKLLPTILSRVQLLELREASRDASRQLIHDLGITDPTKQTQLLYIAEGLPAKLTRLIQDQAYFDAEAQIVRDARILLQGQPYEKLLLAHFYKSDRPGTLALLDIALKMTRQSLTTTPAVRTSTQLETLLALYETISANGNIRLQLTAFML